MRRYIRRCLVCKGLLEKNGQAFCSEACRTKGKIQATQKRDIKNKPHQHQISFKNREKFENRINRLENRQKKKPCNSRRSQISLLKRKLGIKEETVKRLKKKNQLLKSPKYKIPDGFYDSREWQELRYKAIRQLGRKCMACGCSEGEMHVDHIKPRSKYPELQLNFDNLQILCRPCNMGKSNKFEDDWRKNEPSQT